MNGNLASYSKFLKYYAGCFLFFHMVRMINGLGLFQLGQPFIHEVRQDPLVWSLTHSGIPELFAGTPWLSLTMDIVVIIPCLLILILKLSQKSIIKLVVIHLILFAFYLLIIFAFPSLSVRKYLGLAIVPVVFLFTQEKSYAKAIKLLRFYVLFIFSSAAIWKILRGPVFESDQFVNILRNQHLEHLVLFPNHITTHIANYLINHPGVAFTFYILIALWQLGFLVGFFTRKYDKILLLAMIVFILGDFLVMRVEYWEFIVFIPLFFFRRKKHIE